MHETHLSHKHTHTLQQIFQHPASHNLKWHDVVAFMKDIGTVQEIEEGEHNRRLIFTISGVSEVFKHSLDKDVSEIQQVLDIRRFMESAGVKKDGTIAPPGHSPVQEGITEKELHSHDQSRVNAEQNRHAEQQLKTQQNEQNDRSAFMEGNAQAHQQGNRQK